MAIVLPGSFIYLAHLYTGDELVASVLKKLPGAFPAYNKRKGIGHTASLEEVKRVCGDKLLGTETIFSTVRNPYDVLTTMFVRHQNHFQVRRLESQFGRDPNLQEFLEVWLEMNRLPYLEGGKLFYQEAQEFVRYERLQMDIDAVVRRLPHTPGVLPLGPVSAESDKDHWTSYFDDPTYAFVNEHFGEEIAKFGYPFVWSNDSLA